MLSFGSINGRTNHGRCIILFVLLTEQGTGWAMIGCCRCRLLLLCSFCRFRYETGKHGKITFPTFTIVRSDKPICESTNQFLTVLLSFYCIFFIDFIRGNSTSNIDTEICIVKEEVRKHIDCSLVYFSLHYYYAVLIIVQLKLWLTIWCLYKTSSNCERSFILFVKLYESTWWRDTMMQWLLSVFWGDIPWSSAYKYERHMNVHVMYTYNIHFPWKHGIFCPYDLI